MTEVIILDEQEDTILILVPPAEATVSVAPPPSTGVMLVKEGPRGDPGPQGETGHSAYELAVLGGFEGTLEEWLEIPTAALRDHINDPEPHPAYGDMIDLTLIFENGLI